ncbi:MAG: cyclic nucleotide-binding domain-containing protein [Anaerolineales bacterium]|nr:cyclic nucleotide-binding domain-containing protein [Anaerolineales bacterium]
MSLTSIFKQTDIFYGLTPSQLERIAALCQERRFNIGDVIFQENSIGDEIYIIVQGEVDIQMDPSLVADPNIQPTQPVTITTLRRGQSFGEIALVDEGLRSATARCASNNTILLAISRDNLIGLCEEDPQLGYRLMSNLAADLALKIRSTDLRFREELLYGSRHAKSKC